MPQRTIQGIGNSARSASRAFRTEHDALVAKLKEAEVPTSFGEVSTTFSATYQRKPDAVLEGHSLTSFVADSPDGWRNLENEAKRITEDRQKHYDVSGFTRRVVVDLSQEQHAALEVKAPPSPANYSPPSDGVARAIFG